MKPTLIFISHIRLQYIQKQKNSKRVGYKISKFYPYYNRMTQLADAPRGYCTNRPLSQPLPESGNVEMARQTFPKGSPDFLAIPRNPRLVRINWGVKKNMADLC